jgi:AcrR family transcriptional regulator
MIVTGEAMTEQEQEGEMIRAEILNAAHERFRNFGYGKTTMAEIADDVNMSAANLYRYFENKQDIAAACADQCMDDLHTLLANVVKLPNLSATQRLHMFVQTAMRYYYEMSHDTPRLNELVESIAHNHPGMIHQRNQKIESLMAAILKQGMEEDEFQVENISTTARAVTKATVMFTTPIFMPLYALEQFEKMAADVVTLIIKGLRQTN